MYFRWYGWVVLCFLTCLAYGQQAMLSGTIKSADNQGISKAVVALKGTRFQTETTASGEFVLRQVPYGNYTLIAFAYGKQLVEKPISVQSSTLEIHLQLNDLGAELDEVVVQAERERTFGIVRMKAVENFGIYEGKKTEVVVLKDITANLSTNNPRQVFARVPGMNIWESDRAGLQLSIGTRGLNPNRTANFNTRQNGYDMAAESIGYPESYYTPPMEALDRIEVVRGAASLQYGPQFGGMVNFVLKKPSEKKLELTGRQTVGSWQFSNTFASLSGTLKKVGYYGFYQYKTGNGWRPNSDFDQHTAYISLPIQLSTRWKLTPEYTYMTYLAHQPGGLTDLQFRQNPRQSNRTRNWFRVRWNLLALHSEYTFSKQTSLNLRSFVNISGRDALGNLERINLPDDVSTNRSLISDQFQNIGTELRLLHTYTLAGKSHILLVGGRLYSSRNPKQQGNADASDQPVFAYLTPQRPDDSDYTFTNSNLAFFAENIFTLSDKITFTPGIRWEQIHTDWNGYYREYVRDKAGNLVADTTVYENRSLPRKVLLLGAGVSIKPAEHYEVYGNISQNYRAVTFTDLRIKNLNVAIDPNLKDEKGFNTDLGIRGSKTGLYSYDLSVFYMRYAQKIDFAIDTIRGIEVRFRTNVGTSRHVGVEAYGELNILSAIHATTKSQLSVFGSFTFSNALYVRSTPSLEKQILGKQVPFAPVVLFRSGMVYLYKKLRISYQYAYTASHFTDASNSKSESFSTAVIGAIPAYQVMDLSGSYQWKFLTLEVSGNNLLNQMYFTRRADSYPGPGIIPSDGRALYVTLQAKF